MTTKRTPDRHRQDVADAQKVIDTVGVIRHTIGYQEGDTSLWLGPFLHHLEDAALAIVRRHASDAEDEARERLLQAWRELDGDFESHLDDYAAAVETRVLASRQDTLTPSSKEDTP